MSPVTVRDIELALARRFPTERAESWDHVGLLAGDPSATVTGVTLALDPTLSAIESARAVGANVLVTHHPAYLQPLSDVRPGPGPAGVVYAAVTAGVALLNAHTNLDRDPLAQRLLPEALGLTPAEPIERSTMPMALVTVYAPSEAADRIVDEMATAGAGRIGEYERCSFSAEGTGTFTPGPKTSPHTGSPGERSTAHEQRIEMVCPPSRARAVAAAAAAAHPYEEPLITVADVSIARNDAALGMLCEPASEMTLRALVAAADGAFGSGSRVWGDPDASAGMVATTTGSAGSLIRDAVSSGAGTLVCGEVRYHDALDAQASGLSIVELGHDVSEWPLVTLLADTVKSVAGLDEAMVRSLQPRRGWWSS